MQRPERALESLAVLAAQHPHVDLGPGLGRDDVESHPAADHAGVDRDPPGGIGQGIERLDQMGQRQDRARALLRIEAGVGGAPPHRDPEAPDPLARGLEPPLRTQRRLQHEDPAHPAGQAADAVRRLQAAQLLVRVDEEGRRQRRLQAQVAERPKREDPLHQARLHVVGAGPVEPAVAQLDRHALEGAHRPDRVAMADEELARLARVRRRREHLPAARLSRQAPGTETDVPQLRGEAGEERLLGLGRCGGDSIRASSPSSDTISSRRPRR